MNFSRNPRAPRVARSVRRNPEDMPVGIALDVLGLPEAYTFTDLVKARANAQKQGQHKTEVIQAAFVTLDAALRIKDQGVDEGSSKGKRQRRGQEKVAWTSDAVPLEGQKERSAAQAECKLPPAAYIIPVNFYVLNLIAQADKIRTEVPVVLRDGKTLKQHKFYAPLVWDQKNDYYSLGIRVDDNGVVAMVPPILSDIFRVGDTIISVFGEAITPERMLPSILRDNQNFGLLWRYRDFLGKLRWTDSGEWAPTVERKVEADAPADVFLKGIQSIIREGSRYAGPAQREQVQSDTGTVPGVRFPHVLLNISDRDRERLSLQPDVPVYAVGLGSEYGVGSIASRDEDTKKTYGLMHLIWALNLAGLKNKRWGAVFVFPEDYVYDMKTVKRRDVSGEEQEQEKFFYRYEVNLFVKMLESKIRKENLGEMTTDDDLKKVIYGLAERLQTGISYEQNKRSLVSAIMRQLRLLSGVSNADSLGSTAKSEVVLDTYKQMLTTCFAQVADAVIPREEYISSSTFSEMHVSYARHRYFLNILSELILGLGRGVKALDWLNEDPYFASIRQDHQALSKREGSIETIGFLAMERILKTGYMPPALYLQLQIDDSALTQESLEKLDETRESAKALAEVMTADRLGRSVHPDALERAGDYGEVVPRYVRYRFLYAHIQAQFESASWQQPLHFKVNAGGKVEQFEAMSLDEIKDKLEGMGLTVLEDEEVDNVTMLFAYKAGQPNFLLAFDPKEAVEAGLVSSFSCTGKPGETPESVRLLDNARMILTQKWMAEHYLKPDDFDPESGKRQSETTVKSVVGRAPYTGVPKVISARGLNVSPFFVRGYSLDPSMGNEGYPETEMQVLTEAREAFAWASDFVERHVEVQQTETGEKEVKKLVPDLVFGVVVLDTTGNQRWNRVVGGTEKKGLPLDGNERLFIVYFEPGGYQVVPFTARETKLFLDNVAGVQLKRVPVAMGENKGQLRYEFEETAGFAPQFGKKGEFEKPGNDLFSRMAEGFNDRVIAQARRAKQREEARAKKKEQERSAKNKPVRANPEVEFERGELGEAALEYMSYAFSKSMPPRGMGTLRQAAYAAKAGAARLGVRAERDSASRVPLTQKRTTSAQMSDIPAILRARPEGWWANVMSWIRETAPAEAGRKGVMARQDQETDDDMMLESAFRVYGVQPTPVVQDAQMVRFYSDADLMYLRELMMAELREPLPYYVDSYAPAPFTKRPTRGGGAMIRFADDPPDLTTDGDPEVEVAEDQGDVFSRLNPRRRPRPPRARRNPSEGGTSNYQEWLRDYFARAVERQVPRAPSQPDFTKVGEVFPSQRLQTTTATLGSYGERLANTSSYLVQFPQRPPLSAVEVTADSVAEFVGQAGLSLDEARNLARRQIDAYTRRKHTSVPASSAFCANLRSPRLRGYSPPAALQSACGGDDPQDANRKVVIWMAPKGAKHQRIMIFKRNAHIDCDLVERSGVRSRGQLLALALQNVLMWLSEKTNPPRRLQRMRVYVGQIGESDLHLAWKPGDAVTLKAMLDNLASAAKRNKATLCPLENYDAVADRQLYETACKFVAEAEPTSPAPREAEEEREAQEGQPPPPPPAPTPAQPTVEPVSTEAEEAASGQRPVVEEQRAEPAPEGQRVDTSVISVRKLTPEQAEQELERIKTLLKTDVPPPQSRKLNKRMADIIGRFPRLGGAGEE